MADCNIIRVCTIWVDNRDDPSVSVSCGEINRAIPSKDKIKVQFPAPSKQTPIKIDGHEVAAIGATTGPIFYVLDVSGKHTYTMRTIKYGGRDFQDLAKDGTLKLDAKPRILRGQRLYEVNRLDVFLGQAPLSVPGSQHSIETRTVLTDFDPEKDSK